MQNKTIAALTGMALTVLAGAAVVTAEAGASPQPRSDAVTNLSNAASLAVADETPSGNARTPHRVDVRINDVHGRQTAAVAINPQAHGGNQVSVRAWGLTPGFHAIHIHAAGICDPNGPKPFASAGGHFNPTNTAEGMQAGAFPVLLAGPNGQAQAEFTDANFTVAQLITATGTSIVIHALPDNYANIPTRYTAGGTAGPDMETQMTGDAGTRIACGVVFPAHTNTSQPPPPTTPAAHHW